MRKNSKDWNKVLKNLDKEFPEPVINEVIEMPYDPDVSLTDIEVADAEIDAAILLNTITSTKPYLTHRLKKIVVDRYLNSLTLEDVATHFDVSASRVRQLECKALTKIRKSIFN